MTMKRHLADGALTATGIPLGLLTLQGCQDLVKTVISGVLIGLIIQLVIWFARKEADSMKTKKKESQHHPRKSHPDLTKVKK